VAELRSDDAAVEARVLAITRELRCLACRNETVATSSAPLAEDLRREVRAMVRQGAGDDEILQALTRRYGDFIRYRPPLERSTLLLWGGPALLGLGGAAGLLAVLRRRQRLSDAQFEPDPAHDAPEEGGPP
jgi:cytochrome c-type biogenesis protein CcmH